MSGTDLPAAGVTVTVDALTPATIANGSYFVFPLLSPGEHEVMVTGVAANCTSSQPLTQQVRIEANTADSLALDFVCSKEALDAHGILAFSRGDATRFDDPRQKASPQVSPDGSRVAFSMGDSANFWHIWVVNIDGSKLVQLTTDTVVDDHPAWSPDGTKIVFGRRTTPEVSYLVVINADGSNAQRLSPDSVYDANPAWSPDGSRIAFARGVAGTEHVAVMNADGSNFTFLTSNGGPDDGPSWSGDGARIAFASARGGSFGIWIMKSDGTNLQRITPPNTDDAFPAWSK